MSAGGRTTPHIRFPWPNDAVERLIQLQRDGVKPVAMSKILTAEFGSTVLPRAIYRKLEFLGLAERRHRKVQIEDEPPRLYGSGPTLPPLPSLTFGDD